MKIVAVIPISKGVLKESLSYFTSKEVEIGALVTVQVKKKTIPAIIVSVQDAERLKTTLKKAKFSLKSLIGIRSRQFFKSDFIEAAKTIADYFLSPVGPVLKDFVPQAVLENNIDVGLRALEVRHRDDNTVWHEISLVHGSKEERLRDYRRIIREEFAKNHSVFLCLPTTSEIEDVPDALKRGIEKYTVVLHGNLPKKKIKELWNFIMTEKHPLLIIGTRLFLSLPRQDIKNFIVDFENSPFYKLQTRPYLDIRKAVEIIALKSKGRVIFGDNFLRTETHYKNQSMPPQRILSEAENIVVELKPSQIVTQELKESLLEAQEKKEKVVLFINRRGYSPITLCKDCQHNLFCARCESPLVIHKENSEEKRVKFICHKCLYEVTIPEKCPHCGSWNLETLGIGIQKTTEEIKKFLPEAKIFRMDSDTIKTRKEGDDIAKKFFETPGGILVGTEILFSYINQKVDRIAVVSVDALFTLPDFRINEKVFQLLLRLGSLAKKNFIIQTRMPERDFFESVIRRSVSAFYKTELGWRKKLGYPPFKALIKIIKEDKNKVRLKRDITNLTKKLAKWEHFSYPAFIPKIKNIYTWHILLKLNPESWPDKERELHKILSSLSPSWKINVDPDSLL